MRTHSSIHMYERASSHACLSTRRSPHGQIGRRQKAVSFYSRATVHALVDELAIYRYATRCLRSCVHHSYSRSPRRSSTQGATPTLSAGVDMGGDPGGGQACSLWPVLTFNVVTRQGILRGSRRCQTPAMSIYLVLCLSARRLCAALCRRKLWRHPGYGAGGEVESNACPKPPRSLVSSTEL